MISFLFSIQAFGWGAPKILPENERTKTYDFASKGDQKSSYKKALVWSAKTFANSNETIKLKDPDLGMIIAKGNLPCEALKIGSGYAKDQRIEFTLEITAENKKISVKVSDLVGRSEGAYDDGARPSKKEEMDDAVKACIDPFVDKIKSELQ